MSNKNETCPATSPATKRRRRMAREPMIAHAEQLGAPGPIKQTSKTDLVVQLLQRPEGTTISEFVAATGWLPHTTRAALTRLKKKGHIVTSEKVQNLRHYRIIDGAA